MKIPNFMARLLLCLVIFMLITGISKAQYKKIASIIDSVGLYPQDGLVNSGDTLFGTLQQGAKLNGYSQPGALYRVKTDGSAFKSLYNFRDTNGVYPCGGLYLKGNTLFGATRQGGRYFKGNLFSIQTDGTHFKTIFNFHDSLGVTPDTPSFLSGDTIFGTTGWGGKYNQGVLYRIETNGSHYKKLRDFSVPPKSVVLYKNYLYGITCDVLHGLGSIYRIKTNGTGFEILRNYSSVTIPVPSTPLVLIDSTFYGAACAGNSYSAFYKIKPDGSGYEVFYNSVYFSPIIPSNPLIYWNGYLIGESRYGDGVYFKLSLDGKVAEVFYRFNVRDGDSPTGSLLLYNNCLYGTTSMGGGLNCYGTVYRYNLISTVPDKPATLIKISDMICSQMKISWRRGNGTACAVFMRKDNSTNLPAQMNTSYQANAEFGKGSEINTSGWYCLYNGVDSSVTITGIKPVVNYKIAVAEYNVAILKDEKYNVQENASNPLIQKTPKCTQTIFFDVLPVENYGDPPFDPEGKASSGLKVSYSSENTNIASIETNMIKISGSGVTNIVASQAGDSITFPATNVTRVFTVKKAILTVTAADTTRKFVQPNPVFRLKYQGFIGTDDIKALSSLPSASCSANDFSPSGLYDIVVSGGQSNNYDFKYQNGKLKIEYVTYINNATVDGIRIYPNPAVNYLIIERNNTDPCHIQIFNNSGIIVTDRILTDNKIDVSHLPGGLYILKIYGNSFKFEKLQAQ